MSTEQTELELIKRSAELGPINEPTMTLEEAKTFFLEVEKAKKELLSSDDFVEFTDKSGKKRHAPVKAGLERLALYFGLSTLIKPPTTRSNPDGSYFYEVTAICFRGGRGVTETGGCSSLEKEFMDETKSVGRKEHDVLTMATTRAEGRAIRKFLAIKEPSAEEIAGMESKTETTPKICACKGGTNMVDHVNKKCLTCGGKLT